MTQTRAHRRSQPLTLEDEKYPHGTRTGYLNGCRKTYPCPGTPTCSETNTATQNQRRRRKAYGRTSPEDLVSAKEIILALRAWREQHHITLRQIEDLTSYGRRHLTDLLRADPETQMIRRRNRDRLAQVLLGPVPAANGKAVVPRERAVFLMRCLRAMGYSEEWIERNAGVHARTSHFEGRQKGVTKTTVDGLEALVRRIGDRVATPEATGLSEHSILLTRLYAQRQGWRPLADYDDDGNLIETPLDKARAFRERTLSVRLDVLRLLIIPIPGTEIENRLGVNKRLADRVRTDVGLRTRMEGNFLLLCDGQDERLAILRDTVAGHDLLQDPIALWDSMTERLAALDASNQPQREGQRAA